MEWSIKEIDGGCEFVISKTLPKDGGLTGHVVLPDSVNGFPVKAIGIGAFARHENVLRGETGKWKKLQMEPAL